METLESLTKGQDEVRKEVKEIKENHLFHLSLDIATLKTNVEWLLRWHWVIVTSSLGALIAGVINIIK